MDSPIEGTPNTKTQLDKLLSVGLATSAVGVHLVFGFDIAVLALGISLFGLGILGALRNC